MPYLDNGQYYSVHGPLEGQIPCLFLHRGPGHNCYDFEQLIASELSSTVICIDQRGSGRSASMAEQGPTTWKLLFEDIREILEFLGIPKTHLLGHSFGACLAFRFAAAFPQNVDRMVLSNQGISPGRIVSSFMDRLPAILGDPERADAIRRVSRGEMTRTERFSKVAEMVRLVDVLALHQYFRDEARVEHQLIEKKSGLKTSGKAQADMIRDGLLEVQLQNELASITCPTLVIAGKHDVMPLASETEELHQAVSGSSFALFREAGHYPYLEQRSEFVSAVDGFLG